MGWHAVGKDEEIDLAMILSASEPLDPDYITMVAVTMQIGEEAVLENRKDEVLLWEYSPASGSTAMTWNLSQGVAKARDGTGRILNY